MIENEVWRLLLVEDDEDDYFIVYKMLAESRKGKFVLDWVPTYQDGIAALGSKTYDAILVDYDLGGGTGDQLIRDAIALGCQSPMLVLTGRGSYDIDVMTMEAGAADYLNKSELNSQFLERSIRYAVERKRAENALARSNAALHAAERRVRDILSGITDCYFLIDPDWRLIDINANALRYLGKKSEELLGKSLWETDLVMESPDGGADLRVVRNITEPAHFEMHSKTLLRWADVHAYPVEEGTAIYFADITKRKRDEQNTQFLAALGEKLIALDDPDMLVYSSLEAIAEYMHVDHCVLETVLPDQATTEILAEHHAQPPSLDWEKDQSGFRRAFYQLRKHGDALIVPDVAADQATSPLYEGVFQRLDVAAYAGIPRYVDGQWVNTLTVASSAARKWREDEIALLRQAADLIWLAIENARLLKNLKFTQARFDIALKNSEITVYTTDRDLRYTWLYRPMRPYLTEQVIGLRDDELPQAGHLMDLIALKSMVLESRVGLHKEVQLCIGDDTTYLDLTIEPSIEPNGEITGTIVSCINTTHFHQMEEQIQTSIAHVALQRRIMESREEERKQISRDLHDGPIQNTIGLIFSIEAALSLAQESNLQEILTNVKGEAHKLVGELRGVCNQLRPPVLAQFGLSRAIRSYAEGFHEKYPNITMRMDLCDDGQILPEAARLALYRVMQEGLNNVIRHSNATEIKIAYQLADQHANLVIEDNGQGCLTPIDWHNLAAQGHLGLVGMKERTEALNGRLNVVSKPGMGTTVHAVIPYFLSR